MPYGTLVSVGDLQAMKVDQLSAVAGLQSEEDCLLVPLQLADWVSTTLCTQPSLLLKPKLIVDDSLGLTVDHRVAELP